MSKANLQKSIKNEVCLLILSSIGYKIIDIKNSFKVNKNYIEVDNIIYPRHINQTTEISVITKDNADHIKDLMSKVIYS